VPHLGLVQATRLRITSLKFISAVDAGAQGPIANVALVKRAPTGDQYRLTANVAKLDATLGVVFGYAVASTVDGGQSPHIDLQGDAVLGGDELIKVALGFAEAGAESDVMHDCIKDGWVPFVMPLNAETKKAFKLEGDVEGIAIGMKPSAETFKRFQSGELGAFSIYGEGIRTPLDEQKKRAPSDKVQKGSLFTDEVSGHAHKICVYEDGSLYVEWATMEGAQQGHSHGIVRGEDGTLTILADSGHTHELAAGQPGLVIVPADTLVVVQARAPKAPNSDDNGSTAPAAAAALANKSTQTPTPAEGKDTMKLVILTEAQHAHYSKLAAADAEAFIAKSSAERDAVLAEIAKADPVVFKGELTGFEVRKSQGDFALKLAESAEKSAKQAKDALAAAEIEKAAREATELKKRAAETMPHLAGSDDVHCAILKAVESIADEKLRGEALTALKAANDAAKSRSVAKGVNPGADPVEQTASEKLDEITMKYAADHKVDRPTARVEVLKTVEGKRLCAESVGRA
jgi:hypothetical protein